MKKLIALLFLLPIVTHAAEFKSVDTKFDTWNYVFDVKTPGALMSTPLSITEFDCHTPISPKTKKPMFDPPTKCFNTEAEARSEAQKEAEHFEKIKTDNGESTTVIESKRQLLNLGK